MIALGIDPGSTCGWAVHNGETLVAAGTWDIRPPRGSSPGMRYIYLRTRLDEIHKAFPALALVIYEQAHQRGGAATEYAFGCATHIQAWCAERGLEHQSLHTATLKKFATGRGNAKKPEMLAAANADRWMGFRFKDDNEADAAFLAEAGARGAR